MPTFCCLLLSCFIFKHLGRKISLAFIHCLIVQRSLTGKKNLEEVEYLEMKVDTRDNSLGNFGKLSKWIMNSNANDCNYNVSLY